MRGTRLAEMYEKKLYTPPTLSEFSECAAQCVGHIRHDMIIHRLTGDCPRDMLVAPEWNKHKNEILAEIVRTMEERGIKQGSLIN